MVVNIHGFTTGVEPILSIATVHVDNNGNQIHLVVHQVQQNTL
jgi:hypothetical protein